MHAFVPKVSINQKLGNRNGENRKPKTERSDDEENEAAGGCRFPFSLAWPFSLLFIALLLLVFPETTAASFPDSKVTKQRTKPEAPLQQRGLSSETTLIDSFLSAYYNPNGNSGCEFGASVAQVGDVDGDGTLDLAVGTPRDGATRDGMVVLMFLTSSGLWDGYRIITVNSFVAS